MNKLKIAGMIALITGFFSLGFFFGGPGFLVSKMGVLAIVGPWVALGLFFLGIALLVAYGIRKNG